MRASNNEILFNKNGRNEIVKKNANDAKRIIGLLEEHAADDTHSHTQILNLYTKKINSSKDSITNKLQENKLRPFEFLVNNN